LNQSIHRQSFASPTSRDLSTTEISKKIIKNRNSRQFDHAKIADTFSSSSPATRNRYEFPEKRGVKHLGHGRNAGLPHRKTPDDEFGMRSGYGPRRRGLVEEQQGAGMMMMMSGRQRRGRRTPECLQRMRAHRAGRTRMPQSSPLVSYNSITPLLDFEWKAVCILIVLGAQWRWRTRRKEKDDLNSFTQTLLSVNKTCSPLALTTRSKGNLYFLSLPCFLSPFEGMKGPQRKTNGRATPVSKTRNFLH